MLVSNRPYYSHIRCLNKLHNDLFDIKIITDTCDIFKKMNPFKNLN